MTSVLFKRVPHSTAKTATIDDNIMSQLIWECVSDMRTLTESIRTLPMGFVTQTSVSGSGDHDEFTHCDVVLSLLSSQ